ncbi:MAG: N-6 DNA methylase [Candidatus Izemoplasmatales bacterium]|nr:N-6 DNA methylase [Candidatus Izemoplasmatales bacterium]
MINLVNLQENLENLSQNLSKETFIFDLLSAYELPKSTISLLSKNPSKLSGNADQIILKNKVLFHKTTLEEDEHVAIDSLQKNKNSYKFNPRFIIVTDFVTFLAVDTKTKETLDIQIGNLSKHYAFFLPWCGMEKSQHANENPADIRAAYKMDKLYQAIVADDPEYYKNNSHDLNIFLSRLLFCFFAEDTGIFSKIGMFTDSIISHTHENGEGLEVYLLTLFDVLNTEDEKRTKFASHFLEFSYVNGGLFGSKIKLPTFSVNSRKLIIECGKLNWDSINPDIFGSMIQAVVHPGQRDNLGMHYTSVPNIMKVIVPLFLNDLYEDLYNSRNDIRKLNKLRERIAKIKIFDPACGSGNFLIISYKELCKLEIQIIKYLNLQDSFASLDGWNMTQSVVTLNNFYGIEIDDFAHEIARLSLYLAQHQVNQQFEKEFGKLKPILPLRESGKIVCGNATRIDWNEVCPSINQSIGEYEIYVVGNPPYLGGKSQSYEQKEDMALVFKGLDNYKELDYVSCWFILGAKYITNNSKFAFVTTSSLCEGSQVDQIWPQISKLNKEIFFAYKPFSWTNNAKNKAGVTCTIIGVRNRVTEKKYIYSEDIKLEVKNINGYLIEGEDYYISKNKKPISDLPIMITGNSPYEAGNLMLSPEEKKDIENLYPQAKLFMKRAVGSDEFLNGIERWCLWITDSQLEEAMKIPPILEKINKVKEFRRKGGEVARSIANRPHQFRYTHTAKKSLIIIPIVFSSRREYMPIGFLPNSSIVLSSAAVTYDPPLYVFAIISSRMHLLWVRLTSGKLRGDIRYLTALSYNTFPFPNITSAQKESLVSHVYNILEERERYSDKTMAELYNPDKMPDGLREAHKYLDLAIDQIYRNKPFESDEDRLSHLFKLYEDMITRTTNE